MRRRPGSPFLFDLKRACVENAYFRFSMILFRIILLSPQKLTES